MLGSKPPVFLLQNDMKSYTYQTEKALYDQSAKCCINQLEVTGRNT